VLATVWKGISNVAAYSKSPSILLVPRENTIAGTSREENAVHPECESVMLTNSILTFIPNLTRCEWIVNCHL